MIKNKNYIMYYMYYYVDFDILSSIGFANINRYDRISKKARKYFGYKENKFL